MSRGGTGQIDNTSEDAFPSGLTFDLLHSVTTALDSPMPDARYYTATYVSTYLHDVSEHCSAYKDEVLAVGRVFDSELEFLRHRGRGRRQQGASMVGKSGNWQLKRMLCKETGPTPSPPLIRCMMPRKCVREAAPLPRIRTPPYGSPSASSSVSP